MRPCRSGVYFVLAIFCFFFAACTKQNSNRTTVDLIPQLEDADLLWNTGFIDFGEPSARVHMEQGWGTAQKERDGTSVSIVQNDKAILWFHSLHSTLNKQLTIRCR